MSCVWFGKHRLACTLFVLQIIFILLFGFCVDYDQDASPVTPESHGKNCSKDEIGTKNTLHDYYPMFQDVHVMIFIGFGFLMMFLGRYGFSSVGLNMLLAAVAIQWSTLVNGFFHTGITFAISIVSMITADFASASVLITFGALLGKTSPMQMVVVTMFEVFLFTANEYLGLEILKVVDVGGSMFIHAFGAYFGLAVCRVLYNPDVQSSSKEESVYHSDMFAMCGTIFLWLFWPSFNSALAVDDAQHRAVLNTYLALAACCVVAFATSNLLGKDGKFDMVHIQNATLAGGVAVGTSADMMIRPFGALIIGGLAGFLSVVGYKYITPFMKLKLKIHDTCGVNNLHGMPAILAGIAGAVAVSMTDNETYGHTLYRQFPAMAPSASSPFWSNLGDCYDELKPGLGRSAGEQAGHQLLALFVTIAIALAGGTAMGFILKFCTFLDKPSSDDLFEDSPYWHIPAESHTSDFPLLPRHQVDKNQER